MMVSLYLTVKWLLLNCCLGKYNFFSLLVLLFNHYYLLFVFFFSLLDSLTKEPPWVDGCEVCQECGLKFGFTMRKHHW